MSGEKLPGKPKLPKFRLIWLQDSELKSCLSAYCNPADSRKAFCEVCNNAIIAEYCEL